MKKTYKILNIFIIDILALAYILFVPALSGFLNFPLYIVDPMRMMIILALAHTNKQNTYILAFILPLFSFFVGGHPYFLKTSIILLELLLNIYLFYFLISKIRNSFFSMLISIIVCKAFYYGLKFLFISLAFIEGSLLSTPFKYQIITAVVFSLYIQLFFRRRK